MNTGNVEAIKAIITNDDSVTSAEKKRFLAALNGGEPKRRTLITIKKACEILDCHPISVRRYEKRGHLTAIRLSKRKVRWDQDSVLDFANRGIDGMEGGDA